MTSKPLEIRVKIWAPDTHRSPRLTFGSDRPSAALRWATTRSERDQDSWGFCNYRVTVLSDRRSWTNTSYAVQGFRGIYEGLWNFKSEWRYVCVVRMHMRNLFCLMRYKLGTEGRRTSPWFNARCRLHRLNDLWPAGNAKKFLFQANTASAMLFGKCNIYNFFSITQCWLQRIFLSKDP